MKNTKYLLIFLALFFSVIIESCAKSNYTSTIIYDSPTIAELRNENGYIDGPYIFIEDDQVLDKLVFEGNVKTNFLDIKPNEIYFTPDNSIFKDVDEIAVFSDLHGQYDIAVEILKNNNIIDGNLNWNFGNGHLVILGDILDRGPDVTEILWLVYNLEQQANKKGGKVHYLLGNHEFMIMHNDLRYIHEKYETVSDLLKTSYDQLFNQHTFFGKWLRSKSTIIKINDILFVHGGISNELLSAGFDINEINQLLRESFDRNKTEMKAGPFYDKYYGSTGPFWYRGYLKDKLTNDDISKILAKLEVNHIIVGHTSQDSIVQLYDGKIYCVDSSIKNGDYGEILFIRNDNFIRGTLNGEKINIKL